MEKAPKITIKQLRLDDKLLAACHEGAVDEVRRLLARGADPNAEEPSSRTALMAAVAGYSREAVEMLLTAGADPHRVDQWGDNAAMLAVHWNCVKCLPPLFAAGADLSLVNRDGLDIFAIAEQFGGRDVAANMAREELSRREAEAIAGASAGPAAKGRAPRV